MEIAHTIFIKLNISCEYHFKASFKCIGTWFFSGINRRSNLAENNTNWFGKSEILVLIVIDTPRSHSFVTKRENNDTWFFCL